MATETRINGTLIDSKIQESLRIYFNATARQGRADKMAWAQTTLESFDPKRCASIKADHAKSDAAIVDALRNYRSSAETLGSSDRVRFVNEAFERLHADPLSDLRAELVGKLNEIEEQIAELKSKKR